MVRDVAELLHTATIPPVVITFYIYLLQLDSPVSPPRESNMFLNLCNELQVFTEELGVGLGPVFQTLPPFSSTHHKEEFAERNLLENLGSGGRFKIRT